MLHRTVRGTIRYTSKKPEMLDLARGVEHFTFTHHTDGKTTMRAHCCIEEPEPTVMRDIVYSLDERGKPMDCHVRLTVGDQFMGSGWFRFGPDFVECESYGPSIGRLSQRVELNGPIDGMGTHPVVADGYLLSGLGLESTPGEVRVIRVKVPSPDHRGATPPMIAEVNIGAVFIKRETSPPGPSPPATSSSSMMGPAGWLEPTRPMTSGSPTTPTASCCRVASAATCRLGMS